MILLKKNFKFQKRRYFFLLLVLTLILIFTFINSCKKSEQLRYVYIIGGAHEGERIYKFKKTDIYSSHAWEICAIEANPYVIKKIPKASDTVILNRAIWVKDDIIKFYFSPQSDNLSSIYKKNLAKNGMVPIFVKSIDFGQWLKNNFTINDYIVVSFDIEGAEVEVLNKMVMDNTIQYVDELYVEFHPDIGGISQDDINKIIHKIKNSGINIQSVEM